MFPQVIFAIDDGDTLRTRKRFLKYVDNLVAVGKVAYCSPCIGMWEGVLENSYMMRESSFMQHVWGTPWVAGQACFLVVPGDVRQPCRFLSPQGESSEGVGQLKEVGFKEAMLHGGWTYVEATQKYFVLERV